MDGPFDCSFRWYEDADSDLQRCRTQFGFTRGFGLRDFTELVARMIERGYLILGDM